MTELFPFLIFNMLIIFGVHILFSEGMLFEKGGIWIEKKVGGYWAKPLIGCPPCMASVWGTAFYFAFIKLGFILWLPYILALCGLTFIVNYLVHK